MTPGVFDKLDAYKSQCLQLGQGVGPSSFNSARLLPFGHDDDFMADHFDAFKDQHGKKYSSDEEHRERLYAYQNNVRYIMSHNKKQLGYKLAVNHLADRTEAELVSLHPSSGLHVEHVATSDAVVSNLTQDLPAEIDWRSKGAVSPVKDQGICGSCWSFGAAETIEGSMFLKTGKLTKLSSQALVDCSWSFGNTGCDGGLDFLGYEWIMKAGYLPTEASYPYTMADGYCRYEEAVAGAVLKGYVNVTSGDTDALKCALVNQGPISISINAAPKTFTFYSSGVYSDPVCAGGLSDLDHTVLAVGYAVDPVTKQEYWIVKNSWSSYWGDQGFINIAIKDNICGVTTAPTYVLV